MAFNHRKTLLDKPDKKVAEIPGNYESPPCFGYTESDCIGDYSSPPPVPSPSSVKQHQMSTNLIVILCVLGGVAFVVFTVLILHRHFSSLRNSRRRRDFETADNGNFREEHQGPEAVDHPIWYIRTVGLQPSIIDSITVFKYKKDEHLIEGSDCSICLNEFQEDERLRLLPKCSHAFHVPCIDTWLRSHQNCPVCRAPILSSSTNNVPVESVGTRSASNSGPMEQNQVQSELELGPDETREMAEDSSYDAMVTQDDKVAEILSTSRCNSSTRAENECSMKVQQKASAAKLRVLSDLADHPVRLHQELARRSVSADLSFASSTTCHAVAKSYSRKEEGCSSTKLEIVEEQDSEMILAKTASRNSSIYGLIKSYSNGRSLPKGPISMKRSFSFSGKHSRNSSSQNVACSTAATEKSSLSY